jgi:hypothetical protein
MGPSVHSANNHMSRMQREFIFFFFFYKFLLGYFHFMRGGFIVTNPIRLTLYIIYIAPSSIPLNTFPFLINSCFIQEYETIYSNLNLPSPPTSTSTNTYCTYFTVLFFVIIIYLDIQRCVSMNDHCGYNLLWFVQPFPLLSLTPLPPTSPQREFHITVYYKFKK